MKQIFSDAIAAKMPTVYAGAMSHDIELGPQGFAAITAGEWMSLGIMVAGMAAVMGGLYLWSRGGPK